MSKIFLISEDVLKNETILNDNVGSEFIHPAIETSQDIYLQQLIGTELLNKLYDLVKDGTIKNDDNTKYKTLLDDYITNYLKFKVLSEITIPLAYKYRSSGVIQVTNDHTINTTMRDAGLVQNHYEMRATFYAERMTKYLKNNNFPEYGNTRNGSDYKADPEAYKTNIVL